MWHSLQRLSDISHSKKNWTRYVNKTYTGLRVKYPLFVSDFNETWILSTDFRKKNSKFHENPCSGSRIVPCGRTDGRNTDSRTGMAKLIVSFRNFANAPKGWNTCYRNRTRPVFRPSSAVPALLGLKTHKCSKSLSPVVNGAYEHNQPVNSLSESGTFLKSWQFLN